MSGILDRGSLLFASLAVLGASLLLPLPVSFFTPLLILAAVYVPGTLVLSNLFGRLGAMGTVFQRDYSPLLTCTGMAYAAASLPLALAAQVAPPQILYYLLPPALLYFGFLMFFAVRTVFGAENGTAAGVVSLSWIPLVAAVFAWGPLSFLLRFAASPFFLFFAWYYLGSEFSRLGDGLRSRQNFHRMMQAATVNPHDGEAQYQLGLIYQQRRQYGEAIQRFQKAVAIDPSQTDAHFQLGRIAREQGRPRDALAHFQTVVDQDERHSSSEVLRELGGIYVAARQFADARHELETYVERRPYDPEGLFYLGQALEGLGETAAARDRYTAAAEAARTAPRYRQRIVARWSRLAQKQLSKLGSPEPAP
jgi:tetratricopeptide (TPR) repeat protein